MVTGAALTTTTGSIGVIAYVYATSKSSLLHIPLAWPWMEYSLDYCLILGFAMVGFAAIVRVWFYFNATMPMIYAIQKDHLDRIPWLILMFLLMGAPVAWAALIGLDIRNILLWPIPTICIIIAWLLEVKSIKRNLGKQKREVHHPLWEKCDEWKKNIYAYLAILIFSALLSIYLEYQKDYEYAAILISIVTVYGIFLNFMRHRVSDSVKDVEIEVINFENSKQTS
jgi:energy-converting hydrogenase Eha subunit C